MISYCFLLASSWLPWSFREGFLVSMSCVCCLRVIRSPFQVGFQGKQRENHGCPDVFDPRRSQVKPTLPRQTLQNGLIEAKASSLRFGLGIRRIRCCSVEWFYSFLFFPRIRSPFYVFAFLGSPVFSTKQAKQYLFAGVLIAA